MKHEARQYGLANSEQRTRSSNFPADHHGYPASRFTHDVSCLLVSNLIFIACPSLIAAETPVDLSQLPRTSPVQIQFERDIQPILEKNCLRCHGPERPKSHFRLDNRESALKGGENGKDIIPGDSTHSPLIHYVAQLVPDMEMPPVSKGEPLTDDQVGLLRAWIDQGASWGISNLLPQLAFSTTTSLRWIAVKGNQSKFREIEGTKSGMGGGVDNFFMSEQIKPDEKFTAEGRVLWPDNDVQLKLALEKTDQGFVRGGFEVWRKYYDDTGGYYQPFPQPSFSLNRDLYLDIGRAWVDFGLTRPGLPQIVLGYEYQFKQGNKSLLTWGDVNGPNGKNIYPAAEDINEYTHIVKLDVTHDISDWHIENNARLEFYNLETVSDTVKNQLTYTNRFATVPPTAGTVRTHEEADHVQGQNTIHLERQITDSIFVSAGYLYSKLDGDAAFNQTTLDAEGTPTDGLFWYSDEITLKRETHSFSVSGLTRPFEGLNISVGVQPEWIHQEGFGIMHYDEGDPSFLPSGFGLTTNHLTSDLNTQDVAEEVSTRFTRLPWTVLFAEARLSQEHIGQSESQTGDEAAFQDLGFSRDTDFSNNQQDYRAGFNTSPWRIVSLSSDFRNEISDSAYHNNQKSASIAEGYSAFITGRRLDTDQAQAKLSLRPANWLKTSLTYQHVTTDYHTSTQPEVLNTIQISPGGQILAGRYTADVYGINASFAPFRRFYISGSFTYSDSTMDTAQNGDPSVVPYDGHVYSAMVSANFAIDKLTDVNAAYSFSQAAYGQNNVADGLPLGLDYTRHSVMAAVTRKLTKTVTTTLRYSFAQYSEPNTGGGENYTAHGVFATVAVKWK